MMTRHEFDLLNAIRKSDRDTTRRLAEALSLSVGYISEKKRVHLRRRDSSMQMASPPRGWKLWRLIR